MLKKMVLAVIISSIIVSSGVASAATSLPAVKKPAIAIDVIVDGKKVSFPDTEPFTDENNNTMVPLRFVSEKLGADVLWNNDTNIATLKYRGKEIVMPVGSNEITVDGKRVDQPTSAKKVDGRVMVPLRFVSESLESDVKWDGGYSAVTITSPEYQAKIDSGAVKLDDWGRELRSTQNSTEWNLLSDIPDWAYAINKPEVGENSQSSYTSKEEIQKFGQFGWNKENMDAITLNIKNYYKFALNIDYRTINGSTYFSNSFDYLGHNGYLNDEIFKDFVSFVKKNKVITEGYASPEQSTIYSKYGRPMLRVKFKFRVLSATDASQFNMDSYKPTYRSESPKWVKKGVWYEGYSDVSLFTNQYNISSKNDISPVYSKYKVSSPENMFLKNAYKYVELK